MRPGAHGRPNWKRWAVLGAVLLLILSAGAAWYQWRQREQAALDEQAARLRALRDREASLVVELARLPANPTDCPPGQVLKPVGGPAGAGGGAGALPGAAPGPAGPPASAPGSPRAPLPTTGRAALLDGAALVHQLERATAIVIVAGPDGLGTGTGFFIAPNLLVTNRHVVEEAAGKRLFLASKELAALRRASVLRVTGSSTPGSPDVALLRMDDGEAAGTLDMAADTTKLSGVVAAGYPGVVLSGDANFRRLLAGDVAAAPDLNMTRGDVQSLQTGEGGTPLIVHTAAIAKGNSGGPLVDGCGRVVGINTFINVDQSQSTRINYAIHSRVVASFLRSANAQARVDARPCGARE